MASEAKILAALLLALTCSHGRALAAPSSAERETARSLMQDGDRLREAGDDAEALVRYQSAHALMHVPTTGLALAQAQAKLGLLVEARGTLMEVLGTTAAPGEPPVFATARKAAAQLASELEPRVSTLETRVNPASAPYTLQIDDITLPSAARAVPFKTNPGPHSVHVRAPGFEPQTRRLQLFEGATEQLTFELQPEAAPPTPVSQPSAAAIDAPTDDPGASGRTRGFIALGVGAAALAAGLVTGGLSWATTADEKKRCTSDGACDSARADALQRANTLANVANVTLPLGVLGVAYGLYELLSAPSAPPTAAEARLRLELTPQGALLRGAL
jgi:hypothetical protein